IRKIERKECGQGVRPSIIAADSLLKKRTFCKHSFAAKSFMGGEATSLRRGRLELFCAFFHAIDRGGMLEAARRFEVTIRIAWVVVVVGKGVAVLEEELHGFDGDGKAKSLAKRQLHVGDAD